MLEYKEARTTFPFKMNEVVLAKYGGELYYAKIVSIHLNRKMARVLFDDKSRDEVAFENIFNVDETTSDIICVVCKKDSTEVDNDIVLCDQCNIGFHQKCHKPTISSDVLQPEIPWECTYCSNSIQNPYVQKNPFKEIKTEKKSEDNSNSSKETSLKMKITNGKEGFQASVQVDDILDDQKYAASKTELLGHSKIRTVEKKKKKKNKKHSRLREGDEVMNETDVDSRQTQCKHSDAVHLHETEIILGDTTVVCFENEVYPHTKQQISKKGKKGDLCCKQKSSTKKHEEKNDRGDSDLASRNRYSRDLPKHNWLVERLKMENKLDDGVIEEYESKHREEQKVEDDCKQKERPKKRRSQQERIPEKTRECNEKKAGKSDSEIDYNGNCTIEKENYDKPHCVSESELDQSDSFQFKIVKVESLSTLNRPAGNIKTNSITQAADSIPLTTNNDVSVTITNTTTNSTYSKANLFKPKIIQHKDSNVVPFIGVNSPQNEQDQVSLKPPHSSEESRLEVAPSSRCGFDSNSRQSPFSPLRTCATNGFKLNPNYSEIKAIHLNRGNPNVTTSEQTSIEQKQFDSTKYIQKRQKYPPVNDFYLSYINNFNSSYYDVRRITPLTSPPDSRQIYENMLRDQQRYFRKFSPTRRDQTKEGNDLFLELQKKHDEEFGLTSPKRTRISYPQNAEDFNFPPRKKQKSFQSPSDIPYIYHQYPSRDMFKEPIIVIHKNDHRPKKDICNYCQNKAQFLCSGCKVVWYCSRKCQHSDWKRHIKSCN